MTKTQALLEVETYNRYRLKPVAGFTVSHSEDMNACQQQSKMTYHSDGTAIEMRFDDATGNCENLRPKFHIYI